MASIINTYDANSTQVYPKTSTDALVFNDGEYQGAEAIAAALSKNHENLKIGNIEIVSDRKLETPEVVAGVVNASNITASGNLVVDGNTNINSLNVRTGKVSVKDGGIDVSGNIDVSNGYVKAPKANFKDCSFGHIHIDGSANKIIVTGDTSFGNGTYNYTLQQLATQTGVGQHPIYTTPLYVTGAASNAGNSSKTYTDPSVYIKNGSLYTNGLYVGGDRQANQIDPTQIVLKQTATNLISYNKEFNFIEKDYNNSVNINYRTEGNGRGNITRYAFYNGNGSGGHAELDAALYRCRGGRTYLQADASANGQLIIGSADASIRTYIQKDRVVVESSTGKSTFSRDSIELDTTNRYITSSEFQVKYTNSVYFSDVKINKDYIDLHNYSYHPDADAVNSSIRLDNNGIGISTEHKIEITGYVKVNNDVSINGKLKVQGDSSLYSKLYVGGDVSVYGKLYVQGDVSIGGAFNIGSDSITLSGNKYTQDKAYSIVPNSPKLIVLTNSPSQAPVHIQIGYVPAGNVHFIMSSTTSDSTYFKYFTRSGAWKSIKGSAMLVGTPSGDYGLIGIGASI